MSHSAGEKLATPLSITIDLICCALFWTFFFIVLQPFVPNKDVFWIYLWSALTASCMTGVFWMAIQMFRTVLRFQLAGSGKNDRH